MSPSEYLTYYRIDMSKKLISEQPDILLKEVAEMVGFNDQHYFSKTFKKETGMWPTEYRSKK
jgi:YesN/AraC family two-component response regulator